MARTEPKRPGGAAAPGRRGRAGEPGRRGAERTCGALTQCGRGRGRETEDEQEEEHVRACDTDCEGEPREAPRIPPVADEAKERFVRMRHQRVAEEQEP